MLTLGSSNCAAAVPRKAEIQTAAAAVAASFVVDRREADLAFTTGFLERDYVNAPGFEGNYRAMPFLPNRVKIWCRRVGTPPSKRDTWSQGSHPSPRFNLANKMFFWLRLIWTTHALLFRVVPINVGLEFSFNSVNKKKERACGVKRFYICNDRTWKLRHFIFFKKMKNKIFLQIVL